MTENKKERNPILETLRNKYRLVLLNDSTFKEVASLKLNRLNFIFVSGFLLLLFIAAFWSLIAYTPLREMIPGYPDVKMRNDIIQNKIRLDSIELEIKYRDQYFANLNAVIRGAKPEDFQTERISSIGQANLTVFRSESDSILRHDLELAEKLSISTSHSNMANVSLEKLHFFSPVR